VWSQKPSGARVVYTRQAGASAGRLPRTFAFPRKLFAFAYRPGFAEISFAYCGPAIVESER